MRIHHGSGSCGFLSLEIAAPTRSHPELAAPLALGPTGIFPSAGKTNKKPFASKSVSDLSTARGVIKTGRLVTPHLGPSRSFRMSGSSVSSSNFTSSTISIVLKWTMSSVSSTQFADRVNKLLNVVWQALSQHGWPSRSFRNRGRAFVMAATSLSVRSKLHLSPGQNCPTSRVVKFLNARACLTMARLGASPNPQYSSSRVE